MQKAEVAQVCCRAEQAVMVSSSVAQDSRLAYRLELWMPIVEVPPVDLAGPEWLWEVHLLRRLWDSQ